MRHPKIQLPFVVSLVIALGMPRNTAFTSVVDKPLGVQRGIAAPFAGADTPITIVHDYKAFDGWVIGAGMLYWDIPGDTLIDPPYFTRSYMYRMPTHSTRSIVFPDEYPITSNMVADEQGQYAMNTYSGWIYWHPSNSPDSNQITLFMDTPGSVDSLANLVTDASYLYWTKYNMSNDVTTFWRNNRTTSGSSAIFSAVGRVTALTTDETNILYANDSGIWSKYKDSVCTSCSPSRLLAFTGSTHARNFLRYGDDLYWVQYQNPCQGTCPLDRIYRMPALGGTAAMLYQASTSYPHIGQLVVGESSLFWIESGTNGHIRRMPLNVGTTVIIAENLSATWDKLYVDDLGLYFAPDSHTISRLPLKASALQRDFTVDAMEVTQEVQSLANDVPLVADRSTYVRVYARQRGGLDANRVRIALEGLRNNVPLPDSPLYRTGTLPVKTDIDARYDRGDKWSSFNFRLPASWTVEGPITFKATVDPLGDYDDPYRVNNTYIQSTTFIQKSPVCTVFVPVRTHSPKASDNSPRFNSMIRLLKALWPVPDVWVYKQSEDIAETELCWWGPIPHACFGPYELDQGASLGNLFIVPDYVKVLTSLSVRSAFSDEPSECVDAGALTHYVGMVHRDAPTGDRMGMGIYFFPVSWVKLPDLIDDPGLPTWNQPRAGTTLAHEMAHNHYRKHVNCNDPDNIDRQYPYTDTDGTACNIDNRDPFLPTTHFGFDTRGRVPIAPGDAGDLMSYRFERWTSDYTWNALFNKIGNGEQTAEQPTSDVAGENAVTVRRKPDLTGASNAVLVSGAVISGTNYGILNYAWTFPVSALSANSLSRWQEMVAPARYSVVQQSISETAGYHLRLLDGVGALLDDLVIELLPADGTDTAVFALTSPAPVSEVARLELMHGDVLMAAVQSGVQPPRVTILQPAGGEVFTKPFTITWQASDPDPGDQVLFTVQYSSDNGQTWRAITTDFPGTPDSTTVSLALSSLADLPGSNPASLIRVVASDGYHSSIATSPAFQVPDQPPQLHLESPEGGAWYMAGESVPLLGGADDPENGGLSGAALSWQVDERGYGNGSEQQADGLAPGKHQVALIAADPGYQFSYVIDSFNVAPLNLPATDTPSLDGVCDDDAYRHGVALGFKPYSDGSQAGVQLARTSTDLWACFMGLKPNDSSPSLAGLRIDDNNSRDATAQTDDYGFFVLENGSLLAQRGNGSGGFISISTSGMASRVAARGQNWAAEMRISLGALGPQKVKGLAFEYRPSAASNNGQRWPFLANPGMPNTWALTSLGTAPMISDLSPATATVNGPAFTLTIQGSGFAEGAQLNWAGIMRPVTFISSTELRVAVNTADLATARAVDVSVANPGLADAPSFSTTFMVMNPGPIINDLNPSIYSLGGAGLTLTIHGRNFVTGAQVLLNGVPHLAIYVSNTELRTDITGDDQATGLDMGLVVENPQPGGGISNRVEVRRKRETFLPLLSLPPEIIYVNADAHGANTGKTWANAYTNMQSAMAVARHGDEVWVARGVYTPGQTVSSTFQVNPGVALYGGFAATETVRTQRNWRANVTVLSGDLDGNDRAVSGVVTDATGITGTNAYHVVRLQGSAVESITAATTLDGFIITAGSANHYPDYAGGGLICLGAGAGNSCNPTLANVLFSGNSASSYGGAMYSVGSANGDASPTLLNVSFAGNSSQYGGGMFNDGANSGNSSPTLINVLFSGNLATASGGGMYNDGSGNTPGNSSPTLINVTISGNKAAQMGGGILNSGFASDKHPTLINSILWGNVASSYPQISVGPVGADISYSDIQGGCPATVTCGDGMLYGDPQFVAPITADAAPVGAGNYRLQSTSPAIDAGNNLSVTTVTDLDGNPRIHAGKGSVPLVDMGAYER
jgi:predicted outer membrane repeat protein